MRIFFLLGLSLTLNAFASTNMLLPVLTCKLSSADIEKLVQSQSNESESFTILADFENVLGRSDGKSVLVYSSKKVGAVSEKGPRNSAIGAGEFGTFFGTNVDNEIKSGVIFKGDLVIYNDQYKHSTIVNLIVDNEKDVINAELKDSESSDVPVKNYNCKQM